MDRKSIQKRTIDGSIKEKLLEKLQSSEGKYVNMRNIHKHISSTDFSAFFKRMKARYELKENINYTIKKGEGKQIEYLVKIDDVITMINDIPVKK